jgi:hypothetical protein
MRQCKESANRVTPVWKLGVLTLGVLLALRGEGAPMVLVGDGAGAGAGASIGSVNVGAVLGNGGGPATAPAETIGLYSDPTNLNSPYLEVGVGGTTINGSMTATSINTAAGVSTVIGSTGNDVKLVGANIELAGNVKAAHINTAGTDDTLIGNAGGGEITLQGLTGVTTLKVEDLTVNNSMTMNTSGGIDMSSGTSVSIATANSNIEGGLVIDNSQVSLTAAAVTGSGTGDAHGLTINTVTGKTVLSGGTSTSFLTLDDSGSDFSHQTTGAPSSVRGIADGTGEFDAVNRRQLNTAYAGIASVAALAALPQPAPGRHFSLGVGTSYFQGESGVAMGMKGSLTDTTQFSLGGSYNSAGEGLVNGGIGMSW